jgi:hypothetical protein
MKKKIKWVVDKKPTGPYKSFYTRGWPYAFYKDENATHCAHIQCKDEYIPQNVKTGNHSELILFIRDYSSGKTVRVKKTFKTLKEVKEALPLILERNKYLIPGGMG